MRKQKSQKRRSFNRPMVCSDCGKTHSLTVGERRAAARPRCQACGGPLNIPSQATPEPQPRTYKQTLTPTEMAREALKEKGRRPW